MMYLCLYVRSSVCSFLIPVPSGTPTLVLYRYCYSHAVNLRLHIN